MNRPSTKFTNPNPALISLALVALVVAAFWPVVGCGFISIDDPDYFSANPHVNGGMTWGGIAWAFTSFFSSNWHPLTWISLMLDASVFGPGPMGPHLVNLSLHAVNSVLLFFLLRRMTGATWRAALVVALFAVHPLRVESVAWIAERKDVLSAFFGLLALLAYVRYVQEKNRKSFRAAVGLFACSLMSKPMLVTLPFGLLLMDVWPLGRVAGHKLQVAGSAARKANIDAGVKLPALIVEKWPFFLLAAGSCVVTFFAQRAGGAVQAMVDYPFSARVGNVFVSYARYVEKSFVPVHLAMPYPYPTSWPSSLVAFGFLFVLVWVGAVFMLRRRAPFFTMGTLWFLGMLVPVIGLVQVGGQSMADRYTYVPQIGLWLAVVWALGECARRWGLVKPVLVLGAGLAIVTCALTTYVQSQYWKNTEALLTHSIAVTEGNDLAYYQLGREYDGSGRRDDAMQCYRKALEFNRGFAYARLNLADDLLQEGKDEEAWSHYRTLLELNPDVALVHNNCGAALARAYNYDEAAKEYHRALELEPDYADAHYNLALVLAAQGNYSEAIPHYTAAAQKKPQALTFNNLGYALGAVGRNDEVLAAYRRAVGLDPKMLEARVNLGNALAKGNDFAGAEENYRVALVVGSNNPVLLNNLGHALVAQKKLEEGIRDYREALRLKWDFDLARFNLGLALMEQGHPDLAQAEYEKLLASYPGNAQMQYESARALAALGRKAEAQAAAAEAVRLKPDYLEAQELLKRLGQ